MYGQEQGQNQAKIPFSKKKELEAMVAQGKIDMANGKTTDWELVKKLQEAAMGADSSQSMESLKDIKYGPPEQAGGGMPTGAGEGMAPDIGMGRAKGQPGEVPFQSALRNFSFTDGQPASGSMQVGLKSGMTPSDTQKREAYEAQMNAQPGAAVTSPPNMQIKKNFAPWSGGQSAMQENVGQPGQTLQQQAQESVRNEGILDREMANRPQAGPSDNPVIGALRSGGKAAGGYMKSLFDDPQRMAMLQGGLSMMDPNSYYDKQGFGSVFTGLNKGLGAAQAGHAGVQSRRKAIADRQKVEAEAEYTRGGKSGESKAEFERVLSEYLSLPDGSDRKPLLKRRLDSLAPEGGGGTDYNSRYKSDYLWKELMPEADDLEGSLIDFKDMMDNTMDSDIGIEYGFGTDMKANFYAFLEGSLGQDMSGDEGQRLANSRIYMSSMGKQVAKAITAFGAGTGLSDADREFAKSMVGMNPAEFTEDSLRRLQVLNEGAMRGKLMRHNARVKSMYGGEAPDGTLRAIPAMSKNLKSHMVEQMKAGGYKVGGKAVDPNKSPEGWTDAYPDQWKSLATEASGKRAKSRITRAKK